MQRATAILLPIPGVPAAPDTRGDGGQRFIDTHAAGATIPTPTTENRSGQRRFDTQAQSARSEDMEHARNGRHAGDAHDTVADLARLHALLGHYARQLWDIQAQRIAVGNRVAAMERDGLGDYAEPARAIVKEYETIERSIDRELTKIARQHFMADWIIAQRGIGLPGFARILGVTGPLDRFPTVSKLWKYLGLHVVDGHAPKREKGVPWTHTDCQGGHLLTCKADCTTDHHPNCVPNGIGTAYAPKGRVVCHQIGEAIVKVGGDGPYRAAYDHKKAYYEAEREDWTQARRHNAAMRYAVKELIKNMWIEWHSRRPHVT